MARLASDEAELGRRSARGHLAVAMAANVLMFFAGFVGWRLARSTALLADAWSVWFIAASALNSNSPASEAKRGLRG